jgi:hypothetical protein
MNSWFLIMQGLGWRGVARPGARRIAVPETLAPRGLAVMSRREDPALWNCAAPSAALTVGQALADLIACECG